MDLEYNEQSLLRLAGRYGNPKRSYLLLNALQGKHLPASPTQSLTMMRRFGRRLAHEYGDTRLVIGFAETATAIGAVVAACFDDVRYIHTTRELRAGERIFFREEHSHAVEQTLCVDGLGSHIGGTLLLVDDEFSTGRTLCNAVEALRTRFPSVHDCRVVGASLFNRIEETESARLAQGGIAEECLVKLTPRDYDAAVGAYPLRPSETLTRPDRRAAVERLSYQLSDTRCGVNAAQYDADCRALAQTVLEAVRRMGGQCERILVLGTEECMYPALLIGCAVEQAQIARQVLWYATTRSPVGICGDPAYPVRRGVALRSLYDAARRTYLYNLSACDLAVICTDAPEKGAKPGTDDLVDALSLCGCARILFVQGESDV